MVFLFVYLVDFNIVFEDRDSINRNANANEVNARRILKDLMYDISIRHLTMIGMASFGSLILELDLYRVGLGFE